MSIYIYIKCPFQIKYQKYKILKWLAIIAKNNTFKCIFALFLLIMA